MELQTWGPVERHVERLLLALVERTDYSRREPKNSGEWRVWQRDATVIKIDTYAFNASVWVDGVRVFWTNVHGDLLAWQGGAWVKVLEGLAGEGEPERVAA